MFVSKRPRRGTGRPASGRVNDMQLGAAHIGFQLGNALVIMARKLEVNSLHVRISRCCGPAGLFGRASPIIVDVRFHVATPRWPVERDAPRESLQTGELHISSLAALTH